MSADSDFFLKKTITRQLAALGCKTFTITATKPKFAKDGTPIMKHAKSKAGKPLFHKDGSPIMTQVVIGMNLCRASKDAPQIPWTLEDLLQDSNLNKLKGLNVRDFAIYIIPQEQNSDKIYILIDDTSDVIFDIFGKPNNFIQTSPNSQQAVYTVPYVHQRDLYIAIFNYINLMYGDRNLSGLRHPFRLSGFSNRKPKYQDENGRFPFVKTISTTKAMSTQLTEFIKKCASGEFPILEEVQRLRALHKLEGEDQSYDFEEDTDESTPVETSSVPAPAPAPRPRPGGSGIDHRGKDFSAALKAAWQGVEGEDLEAFVAENSMHLINMCGYDTNAEAYIEKTAKNAAQAVSDAKALHQPRPIQKSTGHRHDGARSFLAKKQAFILKRRETARQLTPSPAP